jgi:hypothetical protein
VNERPNQNITGPSREGNRWLNGHLPRKRSAKASATPTKKLIATTNLHAPRPPRHRAPDKIAFSRWMANRGNRIQTVETALGVVWNDLSEEARAKLRRHSYESQHITPVLGLIRRSKLPKNLNDSGARGTNKIVSLDIKDSIGTGFGTHKSVTDFARPSERLAEVVALTCGETHTRKVAASSLRIHSRQAASSSPRAK